MLVGTRCFVSALALVAPAATALAQGSDACSKPEPIGGLGVFAFSTAGATTDGLPATGCTFFGSAEIYNDVWFCWTASDSGLVSLATCGASFDTKLAVYNGCAPCPDESTLLGCNDDSCSLQSKVIVAVEAGASYVVRVGSYSASASGSGDLTVDSGYLADVVNPDNNHRYVAVPATSWSASDALASSLGGHLVSITSDAEQSFVWKTFGNLDGIDRRVWIGFSDIGTEGVFEWTSGEAVTFTNWNDGEPNDFGGNEDVTELLGSSGKWNDMPDSGGSFAHIAVIEFDRGSSGGCVGDLNDTNDVDPSDLAILLGAWGTPAADLNGDGTTDPSDLALLLGAWGPCPG